jgi:hypothetical protein
MGVKQAFLPINVQHGLRQEQDPLCLPGMEARMLKIYVYPIRASAWINDKCRKNMMNWSVPNSTYFRQPF